jgi:hypothetical protein
MLRLACMAGPITAYVLIALSTSAAFAQSSRCLGPVPIRPAAVYCSGAAPICLTDLNGNNGRWAWSCPSQSNSTTLDPSIISNGVRPPQIDDPIDLAIRAEQLRQLRLQNQQMQQQRTNATPAPSVAPAPTPSQATARIKPTTFGKLNGQPWKALTTSEKTLFVAGMENALLTETEQPTWDKYMARHDVDYTASLISRLDKFYNDPLNLRIPIIDAARIVTMLPNGATIEAFEDELYVMRQVAAAEKP